MRLVGPSASSLLACTLLVACAPAPAPTPPAPAPSAAPAPTDTTPIASVAPAASSAAPAAPSGPLVLPAGFFLVVEAPVSESLSVVGNPDGDALVVAIDQSKRRARGARVHGDAITPLPIIDGLLSALTAKPNDGSLGDLAILPDGSAIARWDGGDAATRCQVLRRGPLPATWTSLGGVAVQGDRCGPVSAWGEGAAAVSGTSAGPAMLVPLGKAPKPLERRLASSKAKGRCGVWTTSVLGFAAFAGGEAITVGVPCEAPALTIERFAPGAKASQTATFPKLMIDYPTTITITSPTRIDLRRTIGEQAGESVMLDVQLDFEKGAWKETSRKPSSPRPSGPTDKLPDKRYVTGESWIVGDDVYVLFRPASQKSTLPQIIARSRAVAASFDFRDARRSDQ